MAKKENKKNKSKETQVKSVQDTIPYSYIYKNGIMELDKENRFSKTYALQDVDTITISDEKSRTVNKNYQELLNSMEADTNIQFTIFNERIGKEEFRNLMYIPTQDDGLDEYRKEYNEILADKIREGKANFRHKKYMTVSLVNKNIDEAILRFGRKDAEINTICKRMGSEATPLKASERLELLYKILNPNLNGKYVTKGTIKGRTVNKFDFDLLSKMRRSTKDVIAPSYLNFPKGKDYFQINDKYACILALKDVPNLLSWHSLAKISELPIEMVVSVTCKSLNQIHAMKLIQRQLTKAKKDVMDSQKTATKGGYSTELVPEGVKEAYEQASIKQQDVVHGDEKMFITEAVIMVFGDTLEELEINKKDIKDTNGLINFVTASGMQELGFDDALPLGTKYLPIDNLWTTSETSILQPFYTKELSQANGIYYGQNPISNTPIIYDRLSGVNYNGVILGMSGTGKSFSAKNSILSNRIKNPKDCIYIIDPQGEYTPIVTMLNGEEVKIKPSSNVFLNPLDMDLESADDGSPIAMKSSLICSMFDIIFKEGGVRLSAVQRGIINRCVQYIYKDYMAYMKEIQKTKNITSDSSKVPTLVDLYNCLMAQEEDEARYLAKALEMYALGTNDTFAKRTNVELKKNIVSFNIKEIGENMWDFGLTVTLNFLWTQLIENHKKGITTHIYIDEFHLLTNIESSAQFLGRLYKMARKWGGVLTGITQNIEDLLNSEEARRIINNCSFVYLLSVSSGDRAILSKMFDLSPEQQEYITDNGKGAGLIYTMSGIQPFVNEYPEGTKTYIAMSTKPEDFQENM